MFGASGWSILHALRMHVGHLAGEGRGDCPGCGSPRFGTLFHEFCASSPHKFIFDVNDAPWHTAEWAAAKKADLESKGLGLIFKREYLRDATAGLAGQLISSEWIEAAIGFYQRARLELQEAKHGAGKKIAGLDVADGGADANALAIRHGCRLTFLQRRHDLRADEAGAWAYVVGMEHQVEELRYEALGVGAGAAASLRSKKGIKEITAWSPSDKVLYPRQPWDGGDGRSNGDMFLNLNSQSWWHLRTRFFETFKASQGVEHDPEPVISLDPDLSDLRQLKSELSQVLYKLNANGKVVVDKAPDGYRSPNLADALKICFAPASLGIEIIGIF
jgi:phage terminase large subunit